ncbi:hypothetical protein KUTeg_007497 [Tegillarca granosa]|uniref:Notum n=1 Tax=Tegillarca granosa TaxID=220873 RepID=A0ABQ9FFR3_TEGGR|nr:hypothetical protein KUTeg_007497 [Tegillarca granosa]
MKRTFNLLFMWVYYTSCVVCRPDNRHRHDMPLNVPKLESLGSPETLIQSLKDIAQQSHNCGVKDIPKLRRHFLKNNTITCNDGTSAGYYIRKSYGSKKWIIFLEGGWYCFDNKSCQLRWLSKHMRTYMTSISWPEMKADDYSYLGSYIIEEVIKELLPKGLSKARKMILAGSSAGATGVLMNLDRIADMMKIFAPRVEVRGIADSGWFVDIPQFRPKECTEPFSCAPSDGIKRGVNLWKGRVPEACRNQYPASEEWKSPVFIVQYLFDEAQITVNNLIDPSQLVMERGSATFSQEQWEYLYKLGEHLKNTLHNVTAVFAPACLSHELLTKRDWQSVSVNGVTLAQSIYCWENSFGNEKCLTATHRNTRSVKEERLRRKRKRKQRRKNRKRNRRRKEKKRRRRRKKGKGKNKNKRDRGKRRSQRSAKHVRNCNHHLIELCPLPQWCNGFCPAFRNRFNGEEIDFFKLFALSGIDRSNIADLLNIDVSTARNLDVNTISDLLLKRFRPRNSQ